MLKRGIPGFDSREVQITACLARYHRKSEPSLRHAVFGDLDAVARRTIHQLGALLRLADGLDRSHRNALEGLEFAITDYDVTLYLQSNRNLVSEFSGVEIKKPWFERVYHRVLRAKAKNSAV